MPGVVVLKSKLNILMPNVFALETKAFYCAGSQFTCRGKIILMPARYANLKQPKIETLRILLITFSINFSLEDEWILAKDVVPTKSVKLSSLPISAKVQVSSQLYNYPPMSTAVDKRKRGRKIRPQPRSTALSWHPDYLWLVPWDNNTDDNDDPITAFL